MMRKATLVTLDVWKKAIPLVSGYLQAYACLDPEIEANWTFEHYTNSAKISSHQLVEEMVESNADVYGFSCYVWNMGLIKDAIYQLHEVRPQTHIILGGPQVMHHAHKYLKPAYENIVICNGEGEKTFYNYLKELIGCEPDLSHVRGLSFYREHRLITTEPEERIKHLDDIPSPYLNNLFQVDNANHAFLETNRGCPFGCNYCYWGAAIGAKVNKMGEERVKAEMEWLARNHVNHVFVVDANWGMLRRDVDLSQHLAECKKEYGFPTDFTFCNAKNSPQRVADIIDIFVDAGILLSSAVSLQTMNATALEKVGRKNIKAETYQLLQQRLNDRDIPSYLELIWPLPGETLASFLAGVSQLCALEADCFVCYPLIMMNNVEMNNYREEYGLVTVLAKDLNSEAEVVIQTADVSLEDCKAGWHLIFAIDLLYNIRGFYHVARYLHRAGLLSFDKLFAQFVEFLIERPETELSRLIENPVELSSIEFATTGRLIHYVCHEARQKVDGLLLEFALQQPWWSDSTAQILLEVDLLNRPYIYHNTEIMPATSLLRHIQVLDVNEASGCCLIEFPAAYQTIIKEVLGVKASFQSNIVEVDYRQGQQRAFTASRPIQEYWDYCYYSMMTVKTRLPKWANYKGAMEGLSHSKALMA